MTEDQELQVNRFCHQYLQLEPNLAFPEPSSLREADVQEAIFNRLFSDGSRFHGAPARYQAKVLKELVLKVEASIDDWDQHVSRLARRCTGLSDLEAGSRRKPHECTFYNACHTSTVGSRDSPAEMLRDLPPFGIISPAPGLLPHPA